MTNFGAKEICVTSRWAASFILLLGLATFATSQDPPQTPDRVSDEAMQNLLIRKVSPIYPPLARQARIQGTVILKIVISKSGNVQSLQLVKGHPMLAPAAFEAVRQWKYQPYLSNGEPVEVETNVQVNFALAPRPTSDGIGDAPGGLPPSAIGSFKTTNAQSATGSGTPTRVRVAESIMNGLLIHRVDPVLLDPGVHVQGSVALKAVIDKSGQVQNLQFVSGHPMLVPAAIEAAKQWKYQPFLLNGDPVEVETTMHFDFAKPKSK